MAPGHYPLIVAVHAPGSRPCGGSRPAGRSLAAGSLFVCSSSAASGCSRRSGPAGRRGSSSMPGAPLVRAAPTASSRHPNYLVVAGEIAVLPLAFGLWQVALLFSAAQRRRARDPHRAENKALADAPASPSLKPCEASLPPASCCSPAARRRPSSGRTCRSVLRPPLQPVRQGLRRAASPARRSRPTRASPASGWSCTCANARRHDPDPVPRRRRPLAHLGDHPHAAGLRLKHDHRHEDGSEDKL
jgi:methyltransferase